LVIGIDLDRDSMKHIYEKFGLESGTQDFIGHAMALYLDDEYVPFNIPLNPYSSGLMFTSTI